jgi:DNA transformation protein
MNAEALKELFKPFGEVTVKRMFGGSGVYAQGLCFAIESDGEVFLKVDAESQATFSAAGSSPFIYVAKGKPMPTSYWRLPARAYDEADELRRWASFGLDAAHRAAAAKGKPKKVKPGTVPTKSAVKSK